MADVDPAPQPARRVQVLRRDPGRAQHHVRRVRRRERRPGRAQRRRQDDALQLRLRAAAARDTGTSSSTGTPLAGLPTYKRARLGIGRTYQRVEVFTDMSVRDHLMVAERPRRGEGRLWRDLCNLSKPTKDEDASGSTPSWSSSASRQLADTSVNALGLGNCRLVELARALATEPKILLADEPSSGLDLHETAELAAVLRIVQRERGTAVLLVEHDLSMVAEVVDRTVVMDLGVDAGRGHLRRGDGQPGGARRLPGPDGDRRRDGRWPPPRPTRRWATTSCPSATSAPRTGPTARSSTCRSGCPTAASSPWSAPTARASPPSPGRSPGW